MKLQQDFDFIQQLAHPNYLIFLQKQGYFDEPHFIHYLGYLKYWEKPEFASILCSSRGLKCLNILNMLLYGINMNELESGLAWKNDLLLLLEKDPEYALSLTVFNP